MELGTLFRLILFNSLLHVARGYLSNSPHIITFWGQDPALQEAEKVERALNKTCGPKSSYSTVVLGFVSKSVRNKTTASLPPMHCVKSTKSRSKLSLYCPEISKRVEQCKQNKKKVLIGVGGPNETLYFDDPKSAQYFAKKIWNWFLGGTEISDMRPFGGISLDGVNIFLKDDKSKHVDVFLQTLDKLRKRSLDNRYMYTMSVPCNAPEAYFGEGKNKLSLEKVVPIVKQIYVRYSGKQCCKIGPKHFRGELQNWKKFSVSKDRPALFVLFPRSPHKTMTNCFSSNRQLNILHNMLKYKDQLTGVLTPLIASKWYKAIQQRNQNEGLHKSLNHPINTILGSRTTSKSGDKRHIHSKPLLKTNLGLALRSSRLKNPLKNFLSSLKLKQSILSSLAPMMHQVHNATNITLSDSPLKLLNTNIAKFRKKLNKHPVNVTSVLHILRGNKTISSGSVSKTKDDAEDSDMHIKDIKKAQKASMRHHQALFHPRKNKFEDHSELLQELNSVHDDDDGEIVQQHGEMGSQNASMHVAENKAAEKLMSESLNKTADTLSNVLGTQTKNDSNTEMDSLSEQVIKMWEIKEYNSSSPDKEEDDSAINQFHAKEHANSSRRQANISESIGYILGGGLSKPKLERPHSKNVKKTKNRGSNIKHLLKSEEVKCSANDSKPCNTYKIYGQNGTISSNTSDNSTHNRHDISPNNTQPSSNQNNGTKMGLIMALIHEKKKPDTLKLKKKLSDLKAGQHNSTWAFNITTLLVNGSTIRTEGKGRNYWVNKEPPKSRLKDERKTSTSSDHSRISKNKESKSRPKHKLFNRKVTTPMSIRKHIISNISHLIRNVLRYHSIQRLQKMNEEGKRNENVVKKSHSSHPPHQIRHKK